MILFIFLFMGLCVFELCAEELIILPSVLDDKTLLAVELVDLLLSLRIKK